MFEFFCSSIYLYGRRLVLEWVEDEDSVDVLRKRIVEYFYGCIFYECICFFFFCILKIIGGMFLKVCVECFNFGLVLKIVKKKKDILDDFFDIEMLE